MNQFRAFAVAFFRGFETDMVRVTLRGAAAVLLAVVVSVFLGTGATLGALAWVSTPPSSSTMYTVLTRAVTLTEIQRRTDVVGSTPEGAFTTDLTAGTTTPPVSSQRTDAYVQQIVIRNTSTDTGGTAALLCYGEVAWSGVTTCTALCAAAAATLTCTGATTDSRHIAAGSEFATREDGTVCGCVTGVVGTTTYQTTRIVR
jgi:hypothetical protein